MRLCTSAARRDSAKLATCHTIDSFRAVFMPEEQTEAKIDLRSKWDDFWGPFNLPGEVVMVAFGKQSMEQIVISVPFWSRSADLDEVGSTWARNPIPRSATDNGGMSPENW
mgnify:CR=1 FL=1